MTRSERSTHYELYCYEDEIEHIKAMRSHKRAARGYKRGACIICQTTENVQAAHLYPMSQFALLITPGDIPLISLCRYHHIVFDYLNGLYLKGWNWRNETYYTELEPHTKKMIGELVDKVASKFVEIMGLQPIEYEPMRIQTGGGARLIYRKPD